MQKELSLIVDELKDKDQDYEFYPTDDYIIENIIYDLKNEHVSSILDIGAGDGRTLDRFNEGLNGINRYAIEKSTVLINIMSKDTYIIGTDFHNESLIDKKVDVIFCNPPYSEYDIWAERILSEGNAKYIYLVLPERWSENKRIKQILEDRNLSESFNVIGQFDFRDTNLRQARAKVDIIRFTLTYAKDPFKYWFENNFKFERTEEVKETYKEKINEVVQGKNYIVRMVELYNNEREKLIKTFLSIQDIPYELLESLGVKKESILDSLKSKIKGLKNIFWSELIDNLDSITTRLTKRYRELILKRIMSNTEVEFTESNIYAIAAWIVKNFNDYTDKQLVELFMSFAKIDNIQNYKSNKHLVDDSWRFNQEVSSGEYTHFKIAGTKVEYRIIIERWNSFAQYNYEREMYHGLSENTFNYLNDILTVARTMGFRFTSWVWNDKMFVPGKPQIFNAGFQEQNDLTFMEVKAFKNGNIHIRFAQEFLKRLNIEASRLLGWIRKPADVVDMGYTVKDYEEHVNSVLKIGSKLIEIGWEK